MTFWMLLLFRGGWPGDTIGVVLEPVVWVTVVTAGAEVTNGDLVVAGTVDVVVVSGFGPMADD